MPMSPRRFSGKSPDLGQWMVQCPWINKLIKQGGLRLKPVMILLFVAEDETGRHFSLSGRSLCVLKTSFARSWWHICHVPPGLTSSRSQGRDGRDGKDGRDGRGRICSPGGSEFHDFYGLAGTGRRAEFSCDILIVRAFCEYYGLETVRTTSQMGLYFIGIKSHPKVFMVCHNPMNIVGFGAHHCEGKQLASNRPETGGRSLGP